MPLPPAPAFDAFASLDVIGSFHFSTSNTSTGRGAALLGQIPPTASPVVEWLKLPYNGVVKRHESKLPAILEKRSVVFGEKLSSAVAGWPIEEAMALYNFKASKKPASWTTYEVALRSFFRFIQGLGLRSVRKVETTHITSFIEYLRQDDKADRTISLYLAACSSFFKSMIRPSDTQDTRLMKSNPFDGLGDARPRVEPYQKTGTKREMNLEEYQRILATCDRSSLQGKRDYAILSLTFWTSRRRREIARLNVRDFETENGVVSVRFLTKGGKSMMMELTAGIWAALQDYWTASERKLTGESPAFVATTDAGKYLLKARGLRVPDREKNLAPSAISDMLSTHAKQAKIDLEEVHIHIHGIRHLAARQLRLQGMDLKDIKERLGHSNLNTTDIYLGSMEKIGSEGLSDFGKQALGQ